MIISSDRAQNGIPHLLQTEDVGWDTGLKIGPFFNPERGWQLLLECNQFLFQFKDDIRVDVPSGTIIYGIVALVDYLNLDSQCLLKPRNPQMTYLGQIAKMHESQGAVALSLWIQFVCLQ